MPRQVASKMKTVVLFKVRGDRCDLQFNPRVADPVVTATRSGTRSDYVAEKVFRDLTIAIAAKSERVIAVGNCNHGDDRFR